LFIYLFIARFSFILCLTFVHCPLFKRKRFYSDPGLYSRYFDPIVGVHQLYLLNKNTIIILASQETPIAPILS
jgi:hypothetical protein